MEWVETVGYSSDKLNRNLTLRLFVSPTITMVLIDALEDCHTRDTHASV